jgi:hypothetical protein
MSFAGILNGCRISNKMICCRPMKNFAAIVLCASLTAATVWAEEAETPARRPFCWSLKAPGAGSNSFLLGSIHVAKPGIYPLAATVEDAFSASDVVAVEADPERIKSSRLMAMMLGRAMNVTGRELREVLSDDAYQRLVDYTDESILKIETLEKFEPWYVAQRITMLEMQKLGFKPEYGIEMHFLKKARDKKTIVELEGIENQIEFLDSFSPEEQSLMLEYALLDLENMEDLVDEMMGAWKAGDPVKLKELLHGFLQDADGLADAYKRLFTDRNAKMADKIEGYLKSGKSHFIVVGAGHVVGNDGLIEILRGKEVIVTQLPRTEPSAASAGR